MEQIDWQKNVESKKTESSKPTIPFPEAAFYGSLGKLAKALYKDTEGHPMALLSFLLMFLGMIVKRSRWLKIGEDYHHLIFFIMLVGPSSKGRKGFAKNLAQRCFERSHPEIKKKIKSGISSGEGIIQAVSDEYIKFNIQTKTPETVKRSPSEKCILYYEPEGAKLLGIMQRSGNIVSSVIRDCWDGNDLSVETRTSPLQATEPFIQFGFSITPDELRQLMNKVDISNGFANRFMAIYTERLQLRPFGGSIHQAGVDEFINDLNTAIMISNALIEQGKSQFTLSHEAQKVWNEMYHELSIEFPGLLGSLTARAEPYVLRIAMAYAFMDCSAEISDDHLFAARSFWSYVEASWRFVYGTQLGNPLADRILKVLEHHPHGITKTEIHKSLGNNQPSEKIENALELLRKYNFIEKGIFKGGGRPSEYWRLTKKTK